MTTELATQYRPEQVEPQINDLWLNGSAFHAEPAPAEPSSPEPYAILIPPPNVTAALHMGHALNNTLQDILIRHHRMRGKNAVWMPGTDHAGIATQTVVEKRVLQEENKRRTDFNRETFIAKIQSWKDEYEATITKQLKMMGCSCDWERQRFTMDPTCATAVREAFFRLFQDGLIYRGKRLVNWDPATQTALADDEVEMQEIDGHFYYLRYPLLGPPLEDQTNFVTVATTRPETMLGDTAIAINPRDPRAAALRDRSVLLPIVNRQIPIIEDDYVVLPDPDSTDPKARFASGYLKVTPAHDPNDWEIGQRHGLPIINVMAPDGTISREYGWPETEWDKDISNTNNAEFLLGLDRFEARSAVVKFFKEHRMLEEVKPYRHAVGHSYRSHVPIEPYLSDQWYVKVTDPKLSGAALRAMGDKESDEAQRNRHKGAAWEEGLRFYPRRYAKTFQTWHENIRDWCISRQLWWGHQIPVWVIGKSRLNDPAIKDRIEQIYRANEKDIVRKAHMSDALDESSQQEYWCFRRDLPEINELEIAGFQRDPDVLDTWFSSGLWPLSTMGWPDKTEALTTWNPTNVLCTAREIITLWVSRMVMMNLYFRDCLPFHDVFIHAMIQDSHGQKMSKSLGNGVDPLDIIHSHGADAMRFTLASMTTQTQDVRLPVDLVCPHTGQTFTPKFIEIAGHYVAAPVQNCPSDLSRKMISSYGLASGKAQPSDELPLARNTSEKFDLGRNFANKLWNAVRFALTNLQAAHAESGTQHGKSVRIPQNLESDLPDLWILSRLARTVKTANQTLDQYEFANNATNLYDFIWRDLCDWYIEAIKRTVQSNPNQQQVLATCIDVSLRLLHPIMPFITERLWETLNQTVPQRSSPGIQIEPSNLLVHAPWPAADEKLIDFQSEQDFELIQRVVGAARQARTLHKVPPAQQVTCSATTPQEVAKALLKHKPLLETLANLQIIDIGPDTIKPENAASSMVGKLQLYLHGLIDKDTERERLQKRTKALETQSKTMTTRLANENYVKKAPFHLVKETRSQLAAAEQEHQAIVAQLEELTGT